MKRVLLKNPISYKGKHYNSGEHSVPDNVAEDWLKDEPDAYAELTINPQTADNLRRFRAILSRYRDLWQTARLFLIAGKSGDEWVALAGRILFTDEAPVAMTPPLHPTSDSLIIMRDISVADGEALVTAAVELERIELQANNGNILTVAVGWRNHPWSAAPHIWPGGMGKQGRHCPIAQFERIADRLGERFEFEFFTKLDRRLPLCQPSFDSTASLLRRHMPGMTISAQSNQAIQFNAVLPFRLTYHNDSSALEVNAPNSAFGHDIKVVVNFQDDTSQTFRSGQASGPWLIAIPWPKNIRNASAKVYYDDEFIDELEFTRWKDTVSLYVRAHTHFDPGQKQLRRRLFPIGTSSQSSKKVASEFERGTNELLNLLGFSAVLPGHENGNHSDALAVFQESPGNNIALLIECTLQKPSVKFTPLLARADQLRTHLDNEAEVLPIVFVRSHASTTDMEQAQADGILLADGQVIEQLLSLLKDEVTTGEVMRVLRTYRIPYPRRTNAMGWLRE